MAEITLNPEPGKARIWGVFPDRPTAEKGVIQLEKMGIPTTAISMVIKDESGNVETTTAERAGATMEGSVAGGAAMGGTVGAALGAVTAVALGAPLVGVLLIGPLAGALVGAGAGGATGGVLGALTASGVPENVAEEYQKAVSAGGVVVLADVHDEVKETARQILDRAERVAAETRDDNEMAERLP
ncbi:MAG: hypothetical protein OHK0029_31250 [Armatimonadaceae bacterium]